MRIKPNREVIIDEIVKQIASGSTFSSTLSVCVSRWQINERTFARYWKIGMDRHIQAQEPIKKAEADAAIQAAFFQTKDAVMSANDRKELLTKIAKGELKVKKPFTYWEPGKDIVDEDGKKRWEPGRLRIVEYLAEPDFSDRKAAMAELNRMGGDYAPTQIQAHVITSELPIPIIKVYKTGPELLRSE